MTNKQRNSVLVLSKKVENFHKIFFVKVISFFNKSKKMLKTPLLL